MVYRGSEAKMSGYKHEWEVAKSENVQAIWQHLPTRYEGEGHVQRAHCIALNEEKQPIEGSESSLEADLVLLAVGQSKLDALVADLEGVNTKWGCIEVDEVGRCERPGFFAAGDCANGGKEVVNAVAEGSVAAESIDAYLRGA